MVQKTIKIKEVYPIDKDIRYCFKISLHNKELRHWIIKTVLRVIKKVE
jgi:hypothetical protein